MIKSILAHLTGTPCDASVLDTSLAVARLDRAHITCLHVSVDLIDVAKQASQIDLSNSMILADSLQALEGQRKERRGNAQSTLSAFCERNNVIHGEPPANPTIVSASWQQLVGEDSDCLGAEGRFYDLVVLAGGGARTGRLDTGELGRVIVTCGRPVLLAPEKGPSRDFKTIAIAWKNTPESARAITAAMPFLTRAARIEVLSVNESNEKALECVNCSDGLVRQLRRHGLNAHGHLVLPAGRTVPDAVLQTAHERQADLLVMGAYGHSRLREFVFGGFTRRVLDGVGLPVLLFR